MLTISMINHIAFFERSGHTNAQCLAIFKLSAKGDIVMHYVLGIVTISEGTNKALR